MSIYAAELLFERRPALTPAAFLDAVRRHSPSAELLGGDKKGAVLAVVHPDYPVTYADGPVVPVQTVFVLTENAPEVEALETALQQAWDFPDARAAVGRATCRGVLTDLMAGPLAPAQRLSAFQKNVFAWESPGTLNVVGGTDPTRLIRDIPDQSACVPPAVGSGFARRVSAEVKRWRPRTRRKSELESAMRLSLYMALLGSLSPAPSPAQTPPSARVFDSAGVPIRYVDRGSGDPVLLIHGFAGRLEFWETTGIAAGLTAAGFRVIAYDARGHGNSGKPHDPALYGEEDGEDAVRLLDHLSIQRADVVGYSRGAMIASQLVARHPNRLRSVVFGGWGVDNPVETLSREDCRAAAASLARGAFPVPLAQALQPSGAQLPTTEEQAVITRQLAAGNDMRALAAAFRAGCKARRVTAAALRAAGVPTLAIVGALDGMRPSVHVMAREMAGALEVIVIPQADHDTTPAHPEFTARLVTFLRVASRPPSSMRHLQRIPVSDSRIHTRSAMPTASLLRSSRWQIRRGSHG